MRGLHFFAIAAKRGLSGRRVNAVSAAAGRTVRAVVVVLGSKKRGRVGTPPMTKSEDEDMVSRWVHSRIARFWLRELPYVIVLARTIFGVAYTSVSHRPLIGYWQFLAVAVWTRLCNHR